MPPTVLPTLIAPRRVGARDDAGDEGRRLPTELLEVLERGCPQLRREVDHVVDGDMRARVRWRLGRNRLCRRRFLARDIALRHCGLRHRPDRLACDPIEDVQEALFGRLRDQLARPAVDDGIDQQRRRGDVVIPDRMVNELEVPLARAGFQSTATSVSANRLLPGRLPP